jgi:hypothetical protein
MNLSGPGSSHATAVVVVLVGDDDTVTKVFVDVILNLQRQHQHVIRRQKTSVFLMTGEGIPNFGMTTHTLLLFGTVLGPPFWNTGTGSVSSKILTPIRCGAF